MPHAPNAPRDLLFGLLALQTGLIGQGDLFTAFNAWTRDKARPMAEILAGQGALDADAGAILNALVDKHLAVHGGDTDRSLAALDLGRSTREILARIDDPDVGATLACAGPGRTDGGSADLTASYRVGPADGRGPRFRVLRPHARGGLGEVFVALDEELHREVALKQILDRHADDPVSRQRFVLEAEITGGLEHPGIVPVYALGADGDGRPYYAMRFIRGDSLKEAIARFHAGPRVAGAESAKPRSSDTNSDRGVDDSTPATRTRELELRRLLRRFLDVCNAIDYAHSRGVLHRDIKPGNVIVGKHGETLVVDWGLAKAVGRPTPGAESDERPLAPCPPSGSAETLPGSALGTPAYMSPEQAAGDLDSLGPRSDVYSLGATLYCLLTGKPPFEGDDPGAVLRAVRAGTFPAPRKLDRTVPPALEAVCLKAMATVPANRYGSPRALAEDVERWMADEPVDARREPVVERAARWMRRRRTAVAAAAAALVVAVAGLAGVAAVQSRANHDLRAANDRERARFNLAMDSVRVFHTGVSEDLLLKQKEFGGLRTRLLRGARDFYGRLLGLLQGQTDRPSREALAVAYYEVAGVTGKVGSTADALDLFRHALALNDELAREPDGGDAARGRTGQCLLAIAQLHRETGRYDEMRATLEQARAVFQGLVEAHPGEARYRAGLAQAILGTGVMLSRSGHPAESLAPYERARAIYEGLFASDPSGYGSDLATLLTSTANSLGQTGRPAEALAALERARSIREARLASRPDDVEDRSGLAMTLTNMGYLYRGTGRLAESLPLLERARDLCREVAEASPAVAAFQDALARAELNLGMAFNEVGRKAESLAPYGRAAEVHRRLVAAHPDVPGYRAALAIVHNNTAKSLTEMGRPAEALAAAGEARTILEGLAHEFPDVLQYRLDLTTTLRNLAWMYRAAGRMDEGLASIARALDHCRALAEANPTVIACKEGWAHAEVTAGTLLNESNRSAQSLGSYRRAGELFEELARSNPAGYTRMLAVVRNNTANSLSELGRIDEALAESEKALAILEDLRRANPGVTPLAIDLARTLSNTGVLHRRAGHLAEALARQRKAADILRDAARTNKEGVELPSILAGVCLEAGKVLREAGRPAEAAGELRRAVAILEARAAPPPGESYKLACALAQLAAVSRDAGSGMTASEGEAAAEKAVAALGRAVAAGLDDLTGPSTDPDLDPVRSRPDFQRLVVPLLDRAFPAEPFASPR